MSLERQEFMFGKTSGKSGSGITPKMVFILVALPVFMFVFISTALVTYILPKSYMSAGRVVFHIAKTNNIDGTTGQVISWVSPAELEAGGEIVRAEIEVIRSKVVLEKVVAELDLNTLWGRKYAGGTPLKSAETILLLKHRLEVRSMPNTGILEVRAFDEDPTEAAAIANAVCGAYHDFRTNAPILVRVENLEPAEPGNAPVRPNVPFNLIIGTLVGIVMGLLVGGGAALVMSWIVRRTKAPAF
jgi:capsular polysaccharide biosynthesis protein